MVDVPFAHTLVGEGTDFSGELYDFIEANNISATHFMIGGNIVNSPDMFQRAWRDGGKIVCHARHVWMRISVTGDMP
jgi:peptidoglycan/xylan/chitin deacetylase (PgdA/CDA1 family)